MKSKVISNKRNIFGIIKETVFGSMADFFKELGGTDEDEMQEEAVTPDVKAEVATVEGTTLDNNDYVEVPAGKSVKFGGISSYKRNVDIKQVVKAHEEKLKNSQEKVADKEHDKGAARTRGAR